MSRFERPSEGDSALPERLREGAGTELERRALDAAAGEQPSRELCERMALAIGVAPPPLAPFDPGLSGLGTSSVVGGGSRALFAWLSAGVVVSVAAVVIVGTHSTASAPVPTPAVPSPVHSLPSSQPARPSPSVTVFPGPAPSSLLPRATSAAIPPPPSLRSSTQAADIQEQIRLIDAARAAVAASSSSHALGLVRQYQNKYPTGSFRPEAAALKIEALTQLGRNAEASALADRFAAEYGGGPLTERVSRLRRREGP